MSSLKSTDFIGEKNIDAMTVDELKNAQALALSMSFESRQEFLLQLLKHSVPSFNHDITSPEWLKSDFDNPIWYCLFGKTERVIDFQVVLEDGSLLTDASNNQLLYTFKYLLCCQTHPRYCGGSRLDPSTSAFRVRCALHFIDYVLLRSNYFRPAEYGLGLITSNDLCLFVERIYIGVAEGVYSYSKKTTQHFRLVVMGVSDADVKDFLGAFPDSEFFGEDCNLDLTKNEILRSKVWLWKNGAYKEGRRRENGIGFDTSYLLTKFYGDTLQGRTSNFPIFSEFLIGDGYPKTEYLPVPVKSDNTHVNDRHAGSYKKLIRSLRLVSGNEFLGVGSDVLDEFDVSDGLIKLPEKVGVGRFRSLPGSMVLKAMRDAFEFSFKYADDILMSVSNVLKEQKILSDNKLEKTDSILSEFISDSLLGIGVNTWFVRKENRKPADYFKQVRENFGLLELYGVLMGGIQIIIGILMARRTGELRELSRDCLLPRDKDPHLDENMKVNYSLVFDNRKSGAEGDREQLSRPITRSAAKLIWKLQQFRLRLIEAGLLDADANLLQSIPKMGASLTSSISYSAYLQHLNQFCDYFETMTIELDEGDVRRFYIRQHQLRRFFAMSFFWGSGYDGLDTLRWFLGHTDAEHLWHYITENTPGVVLRGVKAEALVHGLNANNIEGIERLRELLKERFNVSALSIESLSEAVDDFEIDAQSGHVKLDPELEALKQEIEADVETLILEGVIDLEPTFLTVTNDDGEIVQKVTLVLIVKEVECG